MPLSFVTGNRTICCDTDCEVPPGFYRLQFELLDDPSYSFGSETDKSGLSIIFADQQCANDCGAAEVLTSDYGDFASFAEGVYDWLLDLADQAGAGSLAKMETIPGGFRYTLDVRDSGWAAAFGGFPCQRGLKICVCEDDNLEPLDPPAEPCPSGFGRFVVDFNSDPVAPPATILQFVLTHGGGECFDFSFVGDPGVTTGSTAAELATGFWLYTNNIAGVTATINGTTVVVTLPLSIVEDCCGNTPVITYDDTGGNIYTPLVSPLECCPTCPDEYVLDAIYFGSDAITDYLAQVGDLKIASVRTDGDVELYSPPGYGGVIYDVYGDLTWNNQQIGNPALQPGTLGTTPLELATNFADFLNIQNGLGPGITAIQNGEYVNIVIDRSLIECPTINPETEYGDFSADINLQIRYVPGNSTGPPYPANESPTVLRTIYNNVRPPDTTDDCCACWQDGGPIGPGRARFRLVIGKQQLAVRTFAFDDPANGIARPYRFDGVFDGTNQYIQVPAGSVTGNDSLSLATAITNYVNANNGAGDLFEGWQAIQVNTDVVFDLPCFQCPGLPPYINPNTGLPDLQDAQRVKITDANGADVEGLNLQAFQTIENELRRDGGYVNNTPMLCCDLSTNPCDYGQNVGIINVQITGSITNQPVVLRSLEIRNPSGQLCFGFNLDEAQQAATSSFFQSEFARNIATAFNENSPPPTWGAFSQGTNLYLVLPLDSGCCEPGTTVVLDAVDSLSNNFVGYSNLPPDCCNAESQPFTGLIIQNERGVCDCAECINPQDYGSVLIRNNGSDYLTISLNCGGELVINFPNLQPITTAADGSTANEKLVSWINTNQWPDYFARSYGDLIRIFFPKDLVPDCENCTWDWTLDSSDGTVEFLEVECCGASGDCDIGQDKARICLSIDYDALNALPFSNAAQDASFDLLPEAGGCLPAQNPLTALSAAANRIDYLNRLETYFTNFAATYSGTVQRTGVNGANFCLIVDQAQYQVVQGTDVCAQTAEICPWTNMPYDPEGCYLVVESFSPVAGLPYIPNRTELFEVRVVCPGSGSGVFKPFVRNNYSSEANLSTFLDKLVNDFNTTTAGYMERVGTDDVRFIFPCSELQDCVCTPGDTMSVELYQLSPMGQPAGNWWRPTNPPARCIGGYEPPPAPNIPIVITENWYCCPPDAEPEPPQTLNITINNGGITECCEPDPPPEPTPLTPQLVGITEPGLNPLCCPPFAVRLEILDCCCEVIESIDVSTLINREWLGVIRDPLQYIQVLELDPLSIEGCFAVRLTSARGATFTTECYKVEECVSTIQLCGLYPEGTTDCVGKYYGPPDEICGEYFAYKNCLRLRGELIDNGFSISSEGESPYETKTSEFSYRMVTELLPPYIVRELHNIFMAPQVEINGRVFEIPEVDIQQNIRENVMFALDIELTSEGCTINYSCVELNSDTDGD